MATTLPPTPISTLPAPSAPTGDIAILKALFESGFEARHQPEAGESEHHHPLDDLRSLFPTDIPPDRPTVISDHVTNRQFVLVPLPGAPECSTVAVSETSAGHGSAWERLAAAAALILNQKPDYQHLERERDALVDEVSQAFEELHCLSRIAAVLSASGITQDLNSIADEFLPTLCDLVCAEAVCLVREPTPTEMTISHRFARSDSPVIVTTGSTQFPTSEILDLTRHFRQLATTDAIVFNRDSDLQRLTLETTARNIVAVPLAHQKSQYGWIVAINRVPSPENDSHPPSDVRSDEFGTRDVGLLTTAATMLAGHARNVELFRAEESLRVGVIEAITGALDARDPYTCGHSRRVAQLAVQIAERMGFTRDECERLYITGLLHDVGKIGVPDHILRKPDRLTDDEFDVIKQHPSIGHAILLPLRALSFVLPGVLHHHERMDGKGYPHGLSGRDIPLEAKILAVADSYDAMTSDRAYRPGMPIERAIGILQDGAGPQWDSDIVEVFVTSQFG